jgi:hypothetical protein
MYLPRTLKGTLLLWILAFPSGAEPGRDPEEEDRDIVYGPTAYSSVPIENFEIFIPPFTFSFLYIYFVSSFLFPPIASLCPYKCFSPLSYRPCAYFLP